MPEQIGFLFDAPLTQMPASQLPPPRKIEPQSLQVRELLALSADELVGCLRDIAATMPDDIDYDDLLSAAGFPPHSITAWHRSRAMDALLVPHGEFQAYRPETGRVRFRRLPPLANCPGEGCRAVTRGGVHCSFCKALEEEDLWNQE